MTAFKHYSKVWERVRNPLAGKPLANNTRLFKRADDCFAIRVHQTDVVTMFEDGRTVLSTGGWYTMLTKDRISTYAPVRITSREGVWYVSHDLARERAEKRAYKEFGIEPGASRWDTFFDGVTYGTPEYDEARKRSRAFDKCVKELSEVPYFDGIMFGPRGAVLNGIDQATWSAYVKERNAIKKRIQTYCTGFNKALVKGMPMPGGGDCWFCSMFDTGNIRGDQMNGDHSHLMSHIEEGYYVPSLAVNALRVKGYSDTGIFLHLRMKPEDGIMGGEGYRASDGSMGGNLVRRAIRDYLVDRLVPEPPNHDPQTTKRPLRSKRSTGLQTG